MTALVTGATGFVGLHLANKLAVSHNRVTCLVRRLPTEILGHYNPKCEFLIVDESTTVTEFRRIFQDKGVRAVYHAATLFLKDHSDEQSVQLIESNVAFGTKLLQAMKGTKVASFINLSSAWQIHNQSPQNFQRSLYAATKQAFLEILGFYSEHLELTASNFYINDTYGAFDKRKKLIPTLLEHCNSGNPISLSNPSAKINLSYVDDVTDMIAKQHESFVPGVSNFEICNSQTLTLEEVVLAVQKSTGRALNFSWSETGKGKNSSFAETNSDIQKLVNTTPLENGLSRLLSIEATK